MKYEATYGFKETVDKEERYYCAHSVEGYIYKDDFAFKHKKGICYIAESAYDNAEDEYVSAENGYDYSDLLKIVKAKIESDEMTDICPDAFVEYLTENLFQLLDWESPETLLDDTDVKETLTDWLVIETKKKLSALSIKRRSGQVGEDQTFGVVLCWMKDNLDVTKSTATDAAWQVLKDYKLENKHYNEI